MLTFFKLAQEAQTRTNNVSYISLRTLRLPIFFIIIIETH